jgi:energy-coupling factor transport system permease protein
LDVYGYDGMLSDILRGSRLELLLLSALLALIMMLQRIIWTAIYFTVTYCLLLALNEFLWLIPMQPLNMLIAMITLLLCRLIPIYMAYVILLEKTRMNELIVALEQMHIPKILIIPLAVVYHYVPTVKAEIFYIKDSLTMRGLHPSLAGMVLHPITTVEKFMLPLLIRSGKLADELSAAAICKGLDANEQRSSCVQVRFEIQDAVSCIICIIVTAAFIYMSHIKITANKVFVLLI